jgi:hypothetical protein
MLTQQQEMEFKNEEKDWSKMDLQLAEQKWILKTGGKPKRVIEAK